MSILKGNPKTDKEIILDVISNKIDIELEKNKNK